MPCIPLPNVTLPSLPAGLTLSTPTPPNLPNLALPCCTLPPIPIYIPQVSIQIVPTPAMVAAMAAVSAELDTVRDIILTYLRKLPLPCPRD